MRTKRADANPMVTVLFLTWSNHAYVFLVCTNRHRGHDPQVIIARSERRASSTYHLTLLHARGCTEVPSLYSTIVLTRTLPEPREQILDYMYHLSYLLKSRLRLISKSKGYRVDHLTSPAISSAKVLNALNTEEAPLSLPLNGLSCKPFPTHTSF